MNLFTACLLILLCILDWRLTCYHINLFWTVRVFRRLSFLLMFVVLISTSVFQFKKSIFYIKFRVSPPNVSPGAVRTSRTPLGTPLTMSLGTTRVSLPDGILFRPKALAVARAWQL